MVLFCAFICVLLSVTNSQNNRHHSRLDWKSHNNNNNDVDSESNNGSSYRSSKIGVPNTVRTHGVSNECGMIIQKSTELFKIWNSI